MSRLVPTAAWDAYWRFAHNRHEMWLSRIGLPSPDSASDPILEEHRFTNSYRVLDRVSQHLVRDVQYGEGRSQAVDEVFFRTMLFKIFNRIETWQAIEREHGPVSWQSFDQAATAATLDGIMARGRTVYSAAYIMPTPPFGHARKHANHLELLVRMVQDGIPARVASSSSLEEVYGLILDRPGIGPFLAFQYAIDLNYSTIMDHDEADFVVAGPGAHDGLSKCFEDLAGMTAEDAIMETCARQEAEFERLRLPFRGLFGRRLQPIDIQNCYCETSKYTRKSHPEIQGIAGRSRIKQRYRASPEPLPRPFLPPRWGLHMPHISMEQDPTSRGLLL